MVPTRLTGSLPASHTRRTEANPLALSFDALKTRVLAKLEDRLDPSSSKRMPASLLRQSIRTLAEQIAEQEARGLARPERDRLVETVLAELLGYGPLEELFGDGTVREILVSGPSAVIVRREGGPWLPTSCKYRDEEHLRWSLDKLLTHADPVGGTLTSVNAFDLQLPNGFRVMAVVPPPALGHPATAVFVRTEPITSVAAAVLEPSGVVARAPGSPTASASAGVLPRAPGSPTGSASAATTRPGSGSVKAPTYPGSGFINTPPPRRTNAEPGSSVGLDPVARHRHRIIERLIAKLASLGVYDLQRVEITELRRIVTAYVREYVANEKIYMSETDQCRLMLEILNAMQR